MYNSMSMGGTTMYVPPGGRSPQYDPMALNGCGQMLQRMKEEQALRDMQASGGRAQRGGMSGDEGRIMNAMYGGQPRMGDSMDGFSVDYIPGVNMGLRGPDGTGLAGMRGGEQMQGPGVRGYYRMGAIPTGSNSEVIKPQFFDYSGTPDMASMIRNPWDPTQWDPNRDFVPGGRSQSEAYSVSRGGHRLGRGSERRSRMRRRR